MRDKQSSIVAISGGIIVMIFIGNILFWGTVAGVVIHFIHKLW
jgi:hypothetical protein